jgi:hypothetical protein
MLSDDGSIHESPYLSPKSNVMYRRTPLKELKLSQTEAKAFEINAFPGP